MANRALFRSQSPADRAPPATTTNSEGARAYELGTREALALYAATGTFNATFYAKAEDHLTELKGLLDKLGDDDIAFVARLAVYAREVAGMKDVPAFLLAWLMGRDAAGTWFARAFPRVVTNGKMLATFWQVVNSGAAGRHGVGTRPKRVIQRWFDAKDDDFLFHTSIGVAKPGLADVLRAVHPRPATASRRALYGYLSGRNRPQYATHATRAGFEPSRAEDLPQIVRDVEAFKLDPANAPLPAVDFRLLSSLPLATRHWTEIALRASWQTLRMNLSTFARHGVFKNGAKLGDLPSFAGLASIDPRDVIATLAAKLRDPVAVRQARALPYQLLAAYTYAGEDVPPQLLSALHDAMEVATDNVPAIAGRVVVCVDVSGSMQSPVTGDRGEATTKMRCVDIAALFASCVLRKNPEARVLPFEQDVVNASRMPRLEPRDTVMTNAAKLAAIAGGGTNCAAPLALLNREGAQVDAVIYVSDNESWIDPEGRSNRYSAAYHGREMGPTSTMQEWKTLQARCPNARMVCINVQPRTTSQTAPDPRILNVGGFSDEVFKVAARFLDRAAGARGWLDTIEKVDL